MSEYTDGEGGDPRPTPSGDSADDLVSPPRLRGWSRRVIGPFTLRHLLVANSAIAVMLLLLVSMTQSLGATNPSAQPDPQPTFYRISSETQGLELGQRAPDFTGTGDNGQEIRLADLDGHPVSIADLTGRPIWVNFWATWCPPCQRETPNLRAAYEAHRNDGVVLIAIDVQEEAGVVRDYVNRYGLTYTIGLDVTGAVFRTYRVFGLPTHYFIDRNGVIRDRVFGPLDPAGIERRLAEISKP
ncbi:MAG: TlpA family protein disulfide reductase [Chloroflexota bacterium]|nr:TlpA family protein disulfide reductase [Chloroflexota bacterium]